MKTEPKDDFVVTPMHQTKKDHFWLARIMWGAAAVLWLAFILSGTLARSSLGELYPMLLLGVIVSTGVAMRVTSRAADERRRARNRL